MRLKLSALGFLLSAFALIAAEVYVPLVDMGLVGTATNRTVVISGGSLPRGVSGGIVINDKRRVNTGTNSFLWISNAVAGVYLIQVLPPAGSNERSEFRILVTNTTAVIGANSNLVANADNTYPPDTVAYGAGASDLRYLLRSEAGSVVSGSAVTGSELAESSTNSGTVTIAVKTNAVQALVVGMGAVTNGGSTYNLTQTNGHVEGTLEFGSQSGFESISQNNNTNIQVSAGAGNVILSGQKVVMVGEMVGDGGGVSNVAAAVTSSYVTQNPMTNDIDAAMGDFDEVNTPLLLINGIGAATTNQLPYFNVKDFGAFGTNGNDSVAISNAIYKANNSSIGGTIYFPIGTYQDTNTYGVVGNKVSFVGASPDSSVWNLTQTATNNTLRITLALPFISNLKIKGPGRTNGLITGLVMETYHYPSDGYWENCEFSDWGRAGAEVYAASGASFNRVRARDCGIGVMVAGYSDGSVSSFRLDRNVIGLWIGGPSSFGGPTVEHNCGSRYHVMGNNNYIGVLSVRTAGTEISGYMESNTHDFWIGCGPTNAITRQLFDPLTNNPSYNQGLKIANFHGLGRSGAVVGSTNVWSTNTAFYSTNIAIYSPIWGLQVDNYSCSTTTNAIVQVLVDSTNVTVDFQNVGQYKPLVRWYDGTTASGSDQVAGTSGYGMYARFIKGPMTFYDVNVSKTNPVLSAGSNVVASGNFLGSAIGLTNWPRVAFAAKENDSYVYTTNTIPKTNWTLIRFNETNFATGQWFQMTNGVIAVLPGGAGNWKVRAEVPILKGDDMQLRLYRTNNTPAVLAYGSELFSFASDTQAYPTTIDAFITVAVGDLIQLEAFSTGTAAYIGRHGYSGMVYYPSIGTTNFWTSRIEFSR